MRYFLFFIWDLVHWIILSKLFKLSRHIIMMLILFNPLFFYLIIILIFILHNILSRRIKRLIINSIIPIILIWIFVLFTFVTLCWRNNWWLSIILIVRKIVKIFYLIAFIRLNYVSFWLCLFLLLCPRFWLRRRRLIGCSL